jgi:hypothetical protein
VLDAPTKIFLYQIPPPSKRPCTAMTGFTGQLNLVSIRDNPSFEVETNQVPTTIKLTKCSRLNCGASPVRPAIVRHSSALYRYEVSINSPPPSRELIIGTASASKCPHGTTATQIPPDYAGVHHKIMRKKGNESDRASCHLTARNQ